MNDLPSDFNQIEIPAKMESSNYLYTNRIVRFYDNRSIFLTGATGFMGKVSFCDFITCCLLLINPLIYAYRSC